MGHDFESLSGRILEAAVAVHKALGPGFLESVYQKAMEVALRHRTIAFEQQKEIHIF
jgi:GxxExxY protein